MSTESFEANWRNNQTAIFVFSDGDLSRVEFDEILASVLDLTSNVYTHQQNVGGPGRVLRLQVSLATGTVANSPADITVSWIDFVNGPTANVVQIPQHTPQDTNYIITTPGLQSPTSTLLMSSSDLFSAGEIEAYISRSNVETFETDWPAPTPGLE